MRTTILPTPDGCMRFDFDHSHKDIKTMSERRLEVTSAKRVNCLIITVCRRSAVRCTLFVHNSAGWTNLQWTNEAAACLERRYRVYQTPFELKSTINRTFDDKENPIFCDVKSKSINLLFLARQLSSHIFTQFRTNNTQTVV